MNNLRYAIDNIIRKPIKLLLIIIQIIVATTILFKGLTITLETIETVGRTSDLYDGKEVYRLIDKTSIDKLNKIYNDININEKKYELYNFLISSEKFSICAQCDTNILVNNFSDKEEFCYNEREKIINNPYVNIEGKYNNVKGFYIDIGYNIQFPLKVEYGRTFTDNDFKVEDIMNVILGADYQGIYNIGDEFTFFDWMNLRKSKIKVVGILKKNTYIYCGGKIDSLDNRIVCPLNTIDQKNNNISNNFDWWIAQSFIVTNNESESLKIIRNKCLELDLYDFNISSYQTEIDTQIKYLEKNSIISILISVVIFLFISFGIITVQLSEIEEKTKEYGIHLLSGACKTDIVKRIYISSFIYLFIGMCVGTYLFILNNGLYNIRLFIISVGILLFLEIIISFYPARKIKHIQITSYIKGERE